MEKNELSWDGYLRIPVAVLPTISLRHLVSGLDPTIATTDPTVKPTITGFTEWVGTWNRLTITIGWDWGVVNGSVVVINASEIRSNVCLIAQRDEPLQKALRDEHILKWIESMPWREIATRDAPGPGKR